MPMSLKKIMKISTPRQVIEEGKYPATIVGVMYPKDRMGNVNHTKGQFLLQVHGTHGMFYVSTFPFEISFNEDGTLFEILKGFAGASNADQLFSSLDKMGYLGDDTFDEADFIGTSVTATLGVRDLYNGKQCNVVKSFEPIEADKAPALDTNHMIPAGFANQEKYDLVFAKGLVIDCI